MPRRDADLRSMTHLSATCGYRRRARSRCHRPTTERRRLDVQLYLGVRQVCGSAIQSDRTVLKPEGNDRRAASVLSPPVIIAARAAHAEIVSGSVAVGTKSGRDRTARRCSRSLAAKGVAACKPLLPMLDRRGFAWSRHCRIPVAPVPNSPRDISNENRGHHQR